MADGQIPGIDVSHYQGTVSWQQVAGAHANGTVTRSPARHRRTSAPTASTAPASSWPGTCGNRRMSGSWPTHPCQSLRHSPLASTRTTAPCGAGAGSGTVSTVGVRPKAS